MSAAWIGPALPLAQIVRQGSIRASRMKRSAVYICGPIGKMKGMARQTMRSLAGQTGGEDAD